MDSNTPVPVPAEIPSSTPVEFIQLFNWALEFSHCRNERMIMGHLNDVNAKFKNSYQMLFAFSKSNFIATQPEELLVGVAPPAPEKKKKKQTERQFNTNFIKHRLEVYSKALKFNIPVFVSNPLTEAELCSAIKSQLANCMNSVYDSNESRYIIACHLLTLEKNIRIKTGRNWKKEFYFKIKTKFKISRR